MASSHDCGDAYRLAQDRPQISSWAGLTYKIRFFSGLLRFIEYTNAEFHTRKAQPAWLGILGPIIRAEVGDTVIVYFRNKGDRPYSMHPHGLRYTKDDEGADYHPAGRGARVKPGESYTYTWIADERNGPNPRNRTP